MEGIIVAKMTNLERAKQFLPFNALKGYYTLLEEKKKIKEERKILSADEYERLEREFVKIKIGSIIKVKSDIIC